ncbi:hypothetical protein CGI80_05020 [Vibrio parahaemolyticus]|uniref:tyrosine-type recombinase/integrase n=1 Tax=Vibrio parahaemolyticus TaxID=670 RepID=UPI00111FD1D8|nr:tyrosine-type recombinase/integrase [Vibrio parahaemolyticus]TOH53161.1 hypothetical protein CGI80_05020 [Vibrio parahaemolyticus]
MERNNFLNLIGKRSLKMKRPTSITIKKLNKKFLEHIKPHIAESTYLGYRSYANTIDKFIGDEKVADMTTHNLEEFVNVTMLSATMPNGDIGYAKKTRDNYASYLKRIFSYIYKQGLLRSNPCAEALEVLGRDEEVVVKPYTNDEIAVIKRIANDDSDVLASNMALILLLAICTGVRPSELVALTLNDLRKGDTPDTFELVINKALAITTKSNTKNRSSNRVIVLNSSSVDALKKILDRNDIGFEQAVSSNSSELPLVRDPMTNQAFVNPKSLYNRSKAALKNRVCYRGVQPCRHSFATVCADGNISFENIASMLGHSSTIMVKSRYALYRKTAEGAQVLTQMNNLF